jgi:hypothetical protein
MFPEKKAAFSLGGASAAADTLCLALVAPTLVRTKSPSRYFPRMGIAKVFGSHQNSSRSPGAHIPTLAFS